MAGPIPSALIEPKVHTIPDPTLGEKRKADEAVEPEIEVMVKAAATYYSQDAAAKAQEYESIKIATGLRAGDKPLYQLFDEWRAQFHPKARMNKFLQSISASTPELAKKAICPTEYYRYLKNLSRIHKALEKVQLHWIAKGHAAKEFIKPELFRSAGIKLDKAVWDYLRDEKKEVTVDKDLPRYILEVGVQDPEKLVVMMYVIYGTIMSGGQTNKNKVALDVTRGKEIYDDIPSNSGVGLFEIKQNGVLLDDVGISKFKQEWHKSLSLVGKAIPASSHEKLQKEMGLVFSMMLAMLEKHVQGGHC